MSSYNAIFGLGGRTINPSDFIAWYKLDETSGNTLTDSSGNSRDGFTEAAILPSAGPNSWLTSGIQNEATLPYFASDTDQTVAVWASIRDANGEAGYQWASSDSEDNGSVFLPVTANEWNFIAGRHNVATGEIRLRVGDSNTSAIVPFTANADFRQVLFRKEDGFPSVFQVNLAIFSRQLTDIELDEIAAGPEPVPTSQPLLTLGDTTWSGTTGEWANNNGVISYAWELRRDGNNTVIQSGTGTPGGAAPPPGNYYLAITASNDGGSDPLQINISDSVSLQPSCYNEIFRLGGRSPEPSNFVAWYRLDETTGNTLTDYSGNSRTGFTETEVQPSPGPNSWLTSGIKNEVTIPYYASNLDQTVVVWASLRGMSGETGYQWASNDSSDNGSVFLPVGADDWNFIAGRHNVATGRLRLRVGDSNASAVVPFTADADFRQVLFRQSSGIASVFYSNLAIFPRQLTDSELNELAAGPEPVPTSPPLLNFGDTAWSGTPGDWDNQNGEISYSWELRRTSNNAAVQSGTGTPGGDLPPPGNYYLAVTASNAGGIDPIQLNRSETVPRQPDCCSAIGAFGKILIQGGNAPRTFTPNSERLNFTHESVGEIYRWGGRQYGVGEIGPTADAFRVVGSIVHGVLHIPASPEELHRWLPRGMWGAYTNEVYELGYTPQEIDCLFDREHSIARNNNCLVDKIILSSRASNAQENANEFVNMEIHLLGSTESHDTTAWPSPEPELSDALNFLPYTHWEHMFCIGDLGVCLEAYQITIDNQLYPITTNASFPVKFRSRGRKISLTGLGTFNPETLSAMRSTITTPQPGTFSLTHTAVPLMCDLIFSSLRNTQWKTPNIHHPGAIPLLFGFTAAKNPDAELSVLNTHTLS